MAEVHLFEAAAKTIAKQAHRLTPTDKETVEEFLSATRTDKYRAQEVRFHLLDLAIVSKNQLAGQTYRAIKELELESALSSFAKNEPILSTLRKQAIFYAEVWRDLAREKEEAYRFNDL